MSENDYDDLRRRNIAERNAFFSELFQDFNKQTHEVKELEEKLKDEENSENEPPKKRRRTVSGAGDENRQKYRHIKLEFRKKYNTRSSRRSFSDVSQYNDEDSVESRRNKPKLHVLFPWAKPSQRSIDLMKMGVCDVDQEEEQYDDDSYYPSKRTVYKVNKTPYDPSTIPSVEEITDEMLDNIATRSSSKQYCKTNGTCCHQCRQKTLDTKTVCRSGECIGSRGQFCGPCLKGRYGESAVEALKDPNWVCPPCRGLCNCSICRTRSGLRPTGILAPIAHEEGYNSVMDYLQSTELDDT